MKDFQYVAQFIYSIKFVEQTTFKITSLFQYGLTFWNLMVDSVYKSTLYFMNNITHQWWSFHIWLHNYSFFSPGLITEFKPDFNVGILKTYINKTKQKNFKATY